MSEYIVELTEENHGRLMAECDGIHEELVRCRDCRHAIPVTSDPPWLDCTGPLVETWDWQHDEPRMNPVEPEGFCKWGERRKR